MRITNGMMQKAAVGHLQKGLREVAEAQRKVSTGLRLQKASDDVSAASGSMRARGALRALEQHRSNIDVAESRITTEEAILDEVLNVLTRAKELAIGQAGDTASANTRRTVKAELDQLFEHAVQLGNAKLGDDYLFGASNAGTPPFTLDLGIAAGYTAAPPSGAHEVEIAPGQRLATNHTGEEAFEDTGTLAALRSLSKALGDNDPDAIGQAIVDLDTAFGGVQALVGDIGARVNRLDLTRANLDAMEVSLLSHRADLEEVQIEEAMTDLVGRQTALQAAMLATSRVMGLTLADYLK